MLSPIEQHHHPKPRREGDYADGQPIAGRTATARIDALHVLSRQGLWQVLVFLSLSAAALYLRDCNLLASFSGSIGTILGDPPPPLLVNIALAVSSVSAVILLLGKVTGHGEPGHSWVNITLPTLFYPAYILSGSSDTELAMVFLLGLVLLLLEHFTVRHVIQREMEEEKRR